MSGYYQELDAGHFDYGVTSIPGIPDERFRGPAVDPSRPYIVCIGAAQTFGRFCSDPYPAILARRLGHQVLNLGFGGAGPGYFEQACFGDWLKGACLVVFQVLSGRSAGNSAFNNGDTGTLTGTRIRDGKRMRFEEFLEEAVRTESIHTLRRLVEETRDDYAAASLRVLGSCRPPAVLFWFSTRAPAYREDYASAGGIMNEFPQLVNGEVLDRLKPRSAAYVECVSRSGLPQRLWEADTPVLGTDLKRGVLYNHYYPSPEMQLEAADVLEPVCRRLLAP